MRAVARFVPVPCVPAPGGPVMRAVALAAAAMVGLIALAACGGSAPETPSAEPATAQVIQVPTVVPDDGAIQSHLATRVLEVGTQRVAFLLNTQKALVKVPQVRILVAPTDEWGPATEITADYNAWPYGVRGSYVAPVYFPLPGDYRLTVMPVGGEVSGEAVINVSVAADSPIPSIGEAAPASETKTLDDPAEITDLTTAYEPDDELYRMSVAAAVASGKPSVVVFATPAFCTSPTCGPQVDTMSELRVAHPDAANYIHVELYDNPDEIQGDLSQARLVPAADEWGFTQIPGWTNESWVFVLDDEGIVRQRFEGFATLAELEAALAEVGGL